MKDFLKNKLVTGLIIVATLILAGVAIFTAARLYQLRKGSVAPTAPESTPGATGLSVTPTPKACKALSFSLITPTPSPKPSATVTPTMTITPTATSTPTSTPTPTNPPTGGTTPTPTSRLTPTVTPSPTSTLTPTATPTQVAQVTPTPEGGTLPVAGLSIPTVITLGFGILLLLLSLALIL